MDDKPAYTPQQQQQQMQATKRVSTPPDTDQHFDGESDCEDANRGINSDYYLRRRH